MSVNSKMTALADEIRELSGTTTSKSIDTMTSDVDAANAEIAEQAELLEQIATALEGKAGGSGGGSIETCTVVVNISNYTDIFYTAYIDGEFQHLRVNSSTSVQLSNVVINTNIVVVYPQTSPITVTGSVKQNESVISLFGGIYAYLLFSESAEGGSVTISDRFD